MTNTARNLESNVIQLHVVEGNLVRREAKKTKTGEVKKTTSNKVAGVSSEVYPFYEDEIQSMIDVLNDNISKAKSDVKIKKACKYKLLFILGINLGIRASDIRTLKWNFFFNDNHEWREFYTICPQKTANRHKFVKLFFNESVKRAIKEYTDKYPIEDYEGYLFTARNNNPITVQTIWNMLKDVSSDANIDKNIGTHSLRKTWGYHCWNNAEDKNKALIILQRCFNHASPQVTLRYIGLVDNDVRDMFMSVELGYQEQEVNNSNNSDRNTNDYELVLNDTDEEKIELDM